MMHKATSKDRIIQFLVASILIYSRFSVLPHPSALTRFGFDQDKAMGCSGIFLARFDQWGYILGR
jgi:hypothetical protein